MSIIRNAQHMKQLQLVKESRMALIAATVCAALISNAVPYKTWNGGASDNYWESEGNWLSRTVGNSKYDNAFIIGDWSAAKKTVAFESAVDAGNVPLFIEGPNIDRNENDPIVFIADQDDCGLTIGNLNVGDWGLSYLAIERGVYSFETTAINNPNSAKGAVAFRIGGGGYNANVTSRNSIIINKDTMKVAAGGTLVANKHLNINNTSTLLVTAGGALIANDFLKINGNTSTLLVDGGAVTNTKWYATIGDSGGKAGVMTLVNGGIYANSGPGADGGGLVVGMQGKATLNVDGGEVSLATPINMCYYSGSSATINVTGGGVIRTAGFRKFNGTSTMTIDGGTLKAAADNVNFIPDAANLTLTVGAGGATIDTDGNNITIAKAIEGSGAMQFKGGGTVTLNGANTYTGGTSIAAGTKLIVNSDSARDDVLANLFIDCAGVDAEGDYTVFEYSGGGLSTANVRCVNCASGTSTEVVGNTIVVHVIPMPALTLDEDKTWSDLTNGVNLASDSVVSITATGDYTLSIDQDVTVAELDFTGGYSPKMGIGPNRTLTAGDIIGVIDIVNSGTLVKTGTKTVSWPFNNSSTGTTQINGGTLKAASKTGSGTSHTIRVATGATFELNGKELTASVRLAEGATIANNGGHMGDIQVQTVQIILDGNATAAFTKNFGLLAPNKEATRLELGTHTFTLNGPSISFWLRNTTIVGTGTIDVSHGWFTCVDGSNSVGADCTLNIGTSGGLRIYGGCVLSVKNFVNGGTMYNDTGTLQVTGTLTSGNNINRLKLTDGVTIKASATKPQTVSTAFTASGTVTIDASEITEQQLESAENRRVAVLTVPSSFNPYSATWTVSNAACEGCKAKWRNDDSGTTKTLYLVKTIGSIFIFR